MEILIGIIVVIVIIIALIPLVVYLFLAGILSVIICGSGICIMHLFLYLDSILTIRRLSNEINIVKAIKVDFDGDKLSWFVDNDMVNNFAGVRQKTMISLVLGIVTLMCVVFCLKDAGLLRLNLYDTYPSDKATLICISIMSVLGSFAVYSSTPDNIFFPEETYENWLAKQAEGLMSQVERKVDGISKLYSLELSVQSLAGDMGVTFPLDVRNEIHEYVSNHKMDMLAEPEKAARFINDKLEEITKLKVDLERSKKNHQTALAKFDEIVADVNKTNSVALIKELELCYEGLTSENLQSLLAEAKWTEFDDITMSIIDNLVSLAKRAAKYQADSDDVDMSSKETDMQKAFRLFGIPETSSRDDIHKMYHALSKVYHPDKENVKDQGTKRLIEIQWAYEVLKNCKEIS